MSIQRVKPQPDRVVLKEDGTVMTGRCSVDTSRAYYRNRLRDGDIEIVENVRTDKKKKTEKVEVKDDDPK